MRLIDTGDIEREEDNHKAIYIMIGIGILIFCLIIAGIFFFQYTQIWWKGIDGQAQLKEAEYSKQVAVQEAQAKLDSSKLLAQAEVERAKGVAQANQIIGESLKNNEDYLRYLWITDVAGANIDKTIVYVPTETNLPILEASRSSQVK